MNAQEIFDKAATHLLRQGAKSTDSRGFCKFRGCGGRQCAIGVLIPGNLYNTEMEDHGFAGGEVEPALRRAGVSVDDHVGLLFDLQRVHDRRPVSRWPSCLRDLAAKHYLSPQAIDAVTP